jgi:predicted membrane protein
LRVEKLNTVSATGGNMSRKFNPIFDVRILIALSIILLGILALLQNMGIDLSFSIWDWWPLILIFIGIGQVWQPREFRDSIGGFLLIIAGGLLLAFNLMPNVDLNLWSLWPLLLIFFGFKMLRQHIWGFKRTASQDSVNLSAFLGGGEYAYSSRQLRGGFVTAIMGGCEVDLRQADMAEESMTIETFAFWGGIVIKVPSHWQVSMEAAPILGAMESNISDDVDDSLVINGNVSPKRLVVKGAAIMAGIEVKR